MTLDYSNLNLYASSLLIEELVRLGVGRFVISPGSRSAPLTIAAARNREAIKHVHFDERGAAFFALGLARATKEPIALICTSGTAVANFLPAVIEASAEMLPLILLTGDRPPELRDCGSNQTIVQPGLFGKYVRIGNDISCPNEQNSSNEILKIATVAIQAATGSMPGPVHLNCMFREPLVSVDGDKNVEPEDSIEKWYQNGVSLNDIVVPDKNIDTGKLEQVANKLKDAQHGIIIAGTLRSRDERLAVSELAEKLGWPIIADIKSGLRHADNGPHIVPNFNLILNAGGHSLNDVDAIIQVGSRIVSRSLLEFIQTSNLSCYLHIDTDMRDLDPTHLVSDRLTGEISTICDELGKLVGRRSHAKSYDDLFVERDKIEKILQTIDQEDDALTELVAARTIGRLLPEQSSLLLGNSMPIRLFDNFLFSTKAKEIVTNRGASGIDGLVATAAGFTCGSELPMTLVIGDLSLLHDLNSLALLKQISTPLKIIVLNNDGGGIFDHLPSANLGDVHERYFTTPHGLKFKDAASMFSLNYASIGRKEKFEVLYTEAVNDSKNWLIELSIDRRKSFEHQKSVRQRLIDLFKNEQ